MVKLSPFPTVRIRRGVNMYPVFDIPIANTHHVQRDAKGYISRAWITEEVIQWIVDSGLPDDAMSNDWTVLDDWKSEISCFYFTDPQLAMRFKLTFL